MARGDKAGKTEKKAKGEKKERAKRGPTAPSAYIVFCKERRSEVQAENPTASFGEMGKLLGQKWASMSDAEKAPYLKKSQDAKAALKA